MIVSKIDATASGLFSFTTACISLGIHHSGCCSNGLKLHLNPIRFRMNLKRYCDEKEEVLQSETLVLVRSCFGDMDCLLLIKREYKLVENLRVVRPAARVYRGMQLCRIHRPLMRRLSTSNLKSPISNGRARTQTLLRRGYSTPRREHPVATTLSLLSTSSGDNVVSKSSYVQAS